MVRGGKRPGAGRTKINGKELKIKIPEKVYEQLEISFTGKTAQERIRQCLEYGLEHIKKSPKSNSEKFKVLDLFSGAGGLSRGFQDAGFEVVLGVDFDDAALKTFKKNHGDSDILKLDLYNHDNIFTIADYIERHDISLDVLVGGPPCQGFSLAGKREEFDERNILYKAMVKTADLLKPRVVVLENVPGMLTLYNGMGAKRVIDDFTEIGYRVMTPKILYAPDFGVPQIRKRVFFVMLLDSEVKTDFKFPKPTLTEEDYVTTEEAIGDLPSLENPQSFLLDQEWPYQVSSQNIYQDLMRKDSSSIHNHIPTNHASETIRLISMVPEGKNYKSLPEEILEVRKFKYNEALTRYHSKKPSRTIDTGHRTHFHYKWNRIPTVRENARLQSFPDDFIFYGNKQEQYRQVGNAVPPLIGKVLAVNIKEILEHEKN